MKLSADRVVAIAGGGLAGTVLALTLAERGIAVKLYADSKRPSATRVASGLWNPLVFKRYTTTWRINTLLPAMLAFYSRWQKILETPFFYPLPLYRLFGSGDEKALWFRKTGNEELTDFLSPDLATPDFTGISAPFQAAEILQAGYLDTAAFLDSAQNWLLINGMLAEHTFNDPDMQIDQAAVIHRGEPINALIYCIGWEAASHPLFRHLPWRNTKGESLKLVTNYNGPAAIFNRGVHAIAGVKREVHVGATYEWQQLDWQPTEAKRDEMMEKAVKIFGNDIRVASQQAGIRPTLPDRRPVADFLPEWPRVGILSGFGSKGVMMAPFFAAYMADLAENKVLIKDPEVSLSRFKG